MKIRNKLTLLFTAMIAALMIAFALFVYYTYDQYRKDEYYRRIHQQAITKANLLFDTKVDSSTLQVIYKSSNDVLFQDEMAIYDTDFNLIYHDAAEIDKVKETRSMIDEILKKKEIMFEANNLQIVGFLYTHGGKNYIITAAAKDKPGLAKLANLRFTLITALISAIVIIFIAGRFFSKQALQPVSNLVDNVNEITVTNLDLRVNEGNGKDEIAELAVTFNQMLNRLERSFNAQKDFVSNISHELRTPLAAMIGELDLAAAKDRSEEEYKHVINLLRNDAQKLVRLINGLLNLAKANYDEINITLRDVRLDEILLDARHDIITSNKDYKINLSFEKEIENDDFISIHGNEYLLKVAFMNLMENGCKFSGDKSCNVIINYYKDKTVVRISDNGIGIAEEDISKIFTPFYRGKNKKYAEGYGIGMSLCNRIIHLHKGEIYVSSEVNKGTTFTIELPHV
ncbi:HAMP domain-containing sensor histidine kinase [Danxiaibacter flavus]|uniref:histidine kinase n=1 Tax=Danxiaibacter flavus TaxID=3049108 RepID=A0ABV3ZG12_9BACT|nr:HAMP domain-containing sensor histidine kinase [Chitinophagaceae bacterium DXS]